MARKVETHLHYYIAHGLDESADLESIVETTSRLKVAKEQAAASFRDVKITVRLIGHEGGSCNYCALLTAPDKVKLQDALKLFFQEGGLPTFIYGETRVAEELLVPYGKRLRSGFFGDGSIVDA